MRHQDKIQPTNPAEINLKHIRALYEGNRDYFKDKLFGLAEWHKQQIVWRLEKAKACVDNETCLYCGCSMPTRAYANIGCEDPVRKCYPSMMNQEEWEQYKLDNNIEVEIK